MCLMLVIYFIEISVHFCSQKTNQDKLKIKTNLKQKKLFIIDSSDNRQLNF